jgi:hypothetical protein
MKRILIISAFALSLTPVSHASTVLVEISKILPVFASGASAAAAASSIGSTVRLTYSANVEKNEQVADKMASARNYYALSAVCHTTSAVFALKSFRANSRNVDLELQRRVMWAIWGGTLSNFGSLATSLANWEMIPPGGSSNIAGPVSSLVQTLPGAVAAIARLFV